MTRFGAPLAYLLPLALLAGVAAPTPGSAAVPPEPKAAVATSVSASADQVPAARPAAGVSDAEADADFAAAQARYKAMAAGTVSDSSLLPRGGQYEVAVFSDPDKQFHPGGMSQNVALDSIKLVVDVENESLRDIVNDVVGQAAEHTGEWTVKWRLKPENTDLPDERVNLTAEAPFGQFVNLLSERVRNLTGVQLYMTAYAESRVILITDTYY